MGVAQPRRDHERLPVVERDRLPRLSTGAGKGEGERGVFWWVRVTVSYREPARNPRVFRQIEFSLAPTREDKSCTRVSHPRAAARSRVDYRLDIQGTLFAEYLAVVAQE